MAAPTLLRSIGISAGLLGIFALLGTALVVVTHDKTRARIAANQRTQLLKTLHELIDASRYDNALDADFIHDTNAELLGTKRAVTIYRARQNGQPVAAIIAPVAPHGYSGEIALLVGINRDGSVAGVRVTQHRETPGLGDAIEVARSDWIRSFDGHSLASLRVSGWRVKKDGGDFDQFSGATITPRAVVGAVYNALKYYEAHQQNLFAAPATTPANPLEEIRR